jgi:sec-independent protein translocase protein TatB
MFDIGWPDFFVLIVAGLFILGPERLPGAAAWLGKAVRQIREYASGARQQLESELGPEFDELRKPLADLHKLRNFDPKRAVTRSLLDATGGYDPRDDLKLDIPGLNGGSIFGVDTVGNGVSRTNGGLNGGNGANGTKPNGFPAPNSPAEQRPLSPGERPPFDPDAT